jgi:cytidine deaminase
VNEAIPEAGSRSEAIAPEAGSSSEAIAPEAGSSSEAIAPEGSGRPAPDDAALEALVEAARAVRAHAYAPYSDFAVGAAVLAGGRVFTGVNVENASFPIGVCAERNAVAAMATSGERRVDAVAVVTDADVPTPPCGGCRQCLWEFGPDAVVVAATMDGERRRWTLAELLPSAFGPDDLE